MLIRPGLHVVVDDENRVHEVELSDDAGKVVRSEIISEPGEGVAATVIASHRVASHRSNGTPCRIILDGAAFFEALRAIDQVVRGDAPGSDIFPGDEGLEKVEVKDFVSGLTDGEA